MIDFEHVTKIYKRSDTPALEDIDFHVDDGEFVFLVGHSGAGKSTLLKLILREELPTEGRVMVDGKDVARLRRGKVPFLRRQMGIIFQDFRLIPTMTVYENVAFAMHVTKIYKRSDKPALEDIDFHVADGEFVFLVGHSGAGKSTLLKLILREELPTEGRVLVDGKDVARLRRGKVPYLRRQMGIIFQDFRLIPTMTVYENIAFAMHVTNIGKKDIKERVNYMLELVHLEDKAKVYPEFLSGGEQQRVAVARALAHSPRLVIADEPTGNIDPEMSLEMMELLERVSEMGITVLVVTHEHELVRRFNRRTVTLKNGRIISDVPASFGEEVHA